MVAMRQALLGGGNTWPEFGSCNQSSTRFPSLRAEKKGLSYLTPFTVMLQARKLGSPS